MTSDRAKNFSLQFGFFRGVQMMTECRRNFCSSLFSYWTNTERYVYLISTPMYSLIRVLNKYSKIRFSNNIVIIEFCTQTIRLSGLKQGLCLPYLCKSYVAGNAPAYVCRVL